MIESWTNDYICVPFEEKGRERSGVDCWGLVRLIYKEKLGIELPSLLFYKNTTDRPTIKKIYEEESGSHWKQIPFGEEKEYDVIVLRMMGFPMHVGIVLQGGFMIHCLKGSGTVIVNYLDKQWIKRIVGFYRHGDVTDISAPF